MSIIETGGIAIEFGPNGKPLSLRAGARHWHLPERGFFFRLGGRVAEIAEATVQDGRMQATLRSTEGTARLRITAADALRVAVDAVSGSLSRVVELEIFLPDDAEVHLPAHFNTGWRFGADMPVGGECKVRQTYQFALVQFGSDVLRVSSKYACKPAALPGGTDVRGRSAPGFDIQRVPGGFRLTYARRAESPIYLELFGSIEAAADDYAAWLEEAFDVQPQGIASHRPDWLWNTRLALCVDLWRSHGEIAHSYQHVIDLMRDLRSAGAPQDTLLYLPGWNWRYDGHYPEYRPSPVLGGNAKFQEMVATARSTGCRLMLHLCGPGYDPYLPSFQEFKSDAIVSSEDTRIPNVWEPQGEERILTWLGGLITPFPYDSGRRSMTHAWDGNEASVCFDVHEVPARVEAFLTLGGISSGVRVTINGRTQESDDARLTGPQGHVLPFPFFLEKGRNTVTVATLGDQVDDWSRLWYRIRDAKVMEEVWTHPIAGMNINRPKWQRFFVQSIIDLVKTTGVDALHLDTHHVGVSLWDWREPLAALRAALPSTVFGSEVQDEQGLQTFAITQSSNLWPYMDGAFTPGPGPGGPDAWRRRSPVSRLISNRYIRNYVHLVSAHGFVPTGTVVNLDPPSFPEEQTRTALEAVLENADELGVIPTLRVNYRDYGLDPAARAFVAARGAG